LRLAPPWREAYFSRPDLLEGDHLGWRAEVVEAVARAGQVRCTEVAALLFWLAHEGRGPAAGSLRRACVGGDRGLITDGEFQRLAANQPGPFDWQFSPGDADVTAYPVPEPAGSGGLDITNAAAGRRTVVSQNLIILAGSYRLTWRAVSEDGKPSDRVIPAALCVGGPPALHDIRPGAEPGTWQAAIDVAPECRGFRIDFEALPGTSKVRLAAVRLVPR
jgi:hypothetical protein